MSFPFPFPPTLIPQTSAPLEPADVLLAPDKMPDQSEFAAIESRLAWRRWGYLSQRIPQPLIRVWDKEMQLIARVMIPENWDAEELAYEDGTADIEIVGKDNDWLRQIIVFDTKPAEDLHITIDWDPAKPRDMKNRWAGKVEDIVDVEQKGKAVTTTLKCVSNTRHLSHIYLAATPILPPAIQPIKIFEWGGPCVTTCATAVMINLARQYLLNAFSPLPRELFNPLSWLQDLDPRAWPVQVMPPPGLGILDQSRWITIASRWKDARTVLTPSMKDAGVIPHVYQYLPGDPSPYNGVFGDVLGEILKPTRAAVIISFEDQSGVSGITGTAIDGLVNLLAATGDDLITETLFPVDGDGDGYTDPFIRKILGAAPQRPPFVYRDTGYGGVNMKKMTIHKSRATDIITGGKSPQWVNQAITMAIRYGLSQLAQVINYGLGAYEQYGVEGLDNLYQGQRPS